MSLFSSFFSKDYKKNFEFDGIGFDVKLGLGVKFFDFLGGGGIKFEFWWAGKLIFWEGGGIKFEFCWGVLIVRIGRYI